MKPTPTPIRKIRSRAPRTLPTRSAAAAQVEAWPMMSAAIGDSTTVEPNRHAAPPSVASARDASEPRDMNGR